MSKRPCCATCGRKLPPLGVHRVYDAQKNCTVKVCADDRRCQAPYVRKVTTREPIAKNRPYAVNQT
jgi:hypothetical protein